MLGCKAIFMARMDQYLINYQTCNLKILNSTENIMIQSFWIICGLFLHGIANSVVVLSLFAQVCVETVGFICLGGVHYIFFMLLKQ